MLGKYGWIMPVARPAGPKHPNAPVRAMFLESRARSARIGAGPLEAVVRRGVGSFLESAIPAGA